MNEWLMRINDLALLEVEAAEYALEVIYAGVDVRDEERDEGLIGVSIMWPLCNDV